MSNLELPNVYDYSTAEKFLGDKSARTMGYKTRLVQEARWLAVYHHLTPIVKYYPDGHIELTCGGWHSLATANRLHTLTPPHIRVSLSKGTIYVTEGDDGTATMLNGPVVVR